jgi:hypothetical protein
MSVPFPQTTPDDAPRNPDDLLDQRAARSFFDHLARTDQAIGYRLSAEGVVITHAPSTEGRDSPQSAHSWAEVLAYAREQTGRSADHENDRSRWERRQQRRRDRREGR